MRSMLTMVVVLASASCGKPADKPLPIADPPSLATATDAAIACNGPALVAAGDALEIEQQSEQQADYAAAGACGSHATFDALISSYEIAAGSHEGLRTHTLLSGLRCFPREVMTWAKLKLPTVSFANELAVVELAAAVVDKTQHDEFMAMLDIAQTPQARMALASRALDLGWRDKKLYVVIFAALSSTNRDDAVAAARKIISDAIAIPGESRPAMIAQLEQLAAQADASTAAIYNGAAAALARMQ